MVNVPWVLLENNIINRYKTSAKEDVNIDEAGDYLVKNILLRDPKAQKNNQEKPTGKFIN